MAGSNMPADSVPIESAFTDPTFLKEVRRLVGKTNGEHIYSSDVEGITELVLVPVEAFNDIEPTLDAPLTSMDGIEYFTGLKALYCYGNDFTELDVTHNTNLELLDCSFTFLKKLDLSHCPELSFLDCNDTDLQSLDVSKNPKLTTLICYETYLKALDLSHNPLLETVDAWGMYLVTLDVSNNSRLHFLELRYNNMCATDSVVGLDSCTSLETFNFEPQNIVRDGHSWGPGQVTTPPTCAEKGELTYTCVNCGFTKTEEIAATGQHIPGADLDADEKNHWHACTVCGAKLDEAAHTNVWSMDEAQHWLKCAVCGWADSAKAGHIYTDDVDTVCNTCGYERIAASQRPSDSDSAFSGDYYTIISTAGTGGKIVPAGSVSVRENRDKVFTVVPDEGYVVDDVLIDGKSIGAVERYVFEKVSEAHTIEAAFRKADTGYGACPRDESCPIWRCTDTNTSEWYHDGVHYCMEKGLMFGYKGNQFGPDDALTRGMLAQILYNAAGRPAVSGRDPFNDVDSGTWYAGAVAWAAEENVAEGHGNGKFCPGDPITREQLAVMLWRYAGAPAAKGTLDGFPDKGEVSRYALDALCWAVENGVISGRGGGALAPKGETTRAEAAAVLQRYLSETK